MADTAILTVYDKVMKEYYLPPMVEQINQEVVLLNKLETDSKSLVGKYAVIPLHTGRTGGVGATAELGALPVADSQKFDQLQYKLKYLYGRMQISGPVMELTAGTAGAFTAALAAETDGLRRDVTFQTNRQAWGNGDGVLATISSGTASTTQTLTSSEPLVKGYLYPGLRVDIGTLASPTASATAAIVSSVSIANSTVTFESSVTTTTSDVLSVAGSNAASSVSYETLGLQRLVSTSLLNDTTVGNLNPTNAAYWDNQRINVNGNLTQDVMAKLANQIRRQFGKPNLILTSLGIRRAYWNILQSQVRYAQPTNLEGGYQALDFNGMALMEDLYCPYGQMYFLDTNHLFVFSNKDWHWLDQDGHVLKWKVGFDAWEAALTRYMNIGTDMRKVQGVLYGITDPGY